MPIPPENKFGRSIGQSNVYTADEVDALLADAAAGAPVGGFSDAAPLKYSTPEITNSGGQPIGITPDGQFVIRPEIVAGIPVIVGGKKYLIALIAE
jgi:hypothetical protein